MIIEMHAHTAEHSTCSFVSAVALVTRALSKEMQGIVLTDHHYLWSADEIEKLRKEAGLPHHFLLLSGQEIRTADFGSVVYARKPPWSGLTPTAMRAFRWPNSSLIRAWTPLKSSIPTTPSLKTSVGYTTGTVINSTPSAAPTPMR